MHQSNYQNDDYFFITYKSDFFSLHLINGSYYGGEDFILKLSVHLYNDNSKENISFRLELINIKDLQVNYYIKRSFFYILKEYCIYKSTTMVGKIPIFIKNELSHNQYVTIAEFSNKSLEGVHKEKDGSFIISDKKIEYHYVITDEMEGNYTCYYYSDYENILIWWEIGNSCEITLKNLFNITDFYGHIFLENTNFDIKWTDYSPIENFFPLIITIGILSIAIFSFTVIFLLIRRKLKSDYLKRRKKRSQFRRKKKGRNEQW